MQQGRSKYAFFFDVCAATSYSEALLAYQYLPSHPAMKVFISELSFFSPDAAFFLACALIHKIFPVLAANFSLGKGGVPQL